MHPAICCICTHARARYMHIRTERKRAQEQDKTLGANRCWGRVQKNTATSTPHATPPGPRQIQVGGA
eukprot:3005324-Lingulodinium_polyedra.AAC.1